MDTLSPNNCSKSSSNSNSSGNSATSSSMDLGDKQAKQPKRGSRGQKLSRSRSLLQLLSRHLGRHFQHHHHQNDTVYSSQDDIRSSATDLFSLSNSRNDCLQVLNGGSSLDLEHTSRTSSESSSPGLEFYDNNAEHIYVETVYRPGSAMDQLHPNHYDDSGSSVDEDENDNENENENLEHLKPQPEPRSASAASAGVSNKTSGLHLSRISISSSVSRMLQHFSTSAATTATASLRSLSCSSTPRRQRKVSNSSSNSSNSSSSSSSSKSSKKDKKQQSILRPPVQYVYMKGMSGLYSRVPSYAVCCPYTLQHSMY
ncbi:Krueppel-like factor luna [Drosophila montana]|uniref:Krueppel-like factor luna n=1 Tax=Drosophila montana TaxID=40370 RepID=UPI00313A90E2